jgi:hypothetical protein
VLPPRRVRQTRRMHREHAENTIRAANEAGRSTPAWLLPTPGGFQHDLGSAVWLAAQINNRG